MVAVIHSGRSFRNAINYNEKKVKEQVATCLEAANYPKDLADLNFYQKLSRLQKQADLNIRTKVNSVHISLNFHPSEKLSEDLLREITKTYLEKIGFENQPYLLYQHNDSGHPHVHIVTTNIRADGSRIELHNLGRNQSEKARHEIEIAYGLKPAEQSKKEQVFELKAYSSGKVEYGRSEMKRAITNVLDVVLNQYKFTSIAEFNAVLKQYNVVADRGSKNSRTYNNKGLVYRILDDQGNKVGVPIKASLIYSKPTLTCLEQKYAANQQARQPHNGRVKTSIDLALLRSPNQSLADLTGTLKKDGISTVFRQNESRLIYGLTYVDHKTKCVFNGSDLGKQYTTKGIAERLAIATEPVAEKHQDLDQSQKRAPFRKHEAEEASALGKQGILEALLMPEQSAEQIPNQLKRSGKKKKRKHISRHL
ncbi:relaxase [Segetibacter sp. 3557_3]|uniref:relaxase/mobilization nuclease domain-containing protein n=1 Tax=Segetibacter sp. 3557_3 TaxID=2547429 RepID=UPI00105843A2|nr:relaxase/mobilization nuclease domain-containing protein [Segetibacter sp. 3557_3]TDH18486.1 relaxase [Segetibacter sp. 3557_3]